MSKIDPMIQKLVDHAIHHAAIARNGESNRATVNSIARALTARLRTPGTVEVGSGAMLFAIAVIESIQEDNYGDSWPPECIQDALDYAKSNGLDTDTDSDDVLAEIRAALAKEDTNG